MFSFNLHIFWGEVDAGKLLRGMMTMVVVFLSHIAGIWAAKISASANASLKASLVDLKSLRSS